MLPSSPGPEQAPESPPPEPPPRPPLAQRLAAGIEGLLAWLPLAIAIGVSPGITIWQLLIDEPAFLEDNVLDTAARLQGAAAALGSLALVGLTIAALVIRQRRRGLELRQAMRRVLGWLSPLLALPFLPWLAQRGNEVSRPFVTLLFAAAIAAGAAAIAYRAPLGAPSRGWPALLVVLAATAGYGLALSIFSIRQHHAFYTQVFDLALYDNIFYQSIHGRPLGTNFVRGGTHLAGHFDPILVVLSPLYLIYPRAELLLVLQSFWLALGAVPLFFLARRHLESPLAAAVVPVVYLLHPALQGANMYDFHSLSLVIPLVIAAVTLLDAGRYRWFFALLPLMLLVREDVSLLLCFVGLWLILSRRAPRVGFATIGVSLLYFVLVKAVFMRTGLLNEGIGDNVSHSYSYYYKDLIPNGKEGSPGLFLSLLINPVFALSLIFGEEKMLYLLRMFLPVLFLPLFAGKARWMLVFGLVSVLLASKPPMFSLYFQYVATVLPLALALAPIGAGALASGEVPGFASLDPRRLVRALAAGMLVAAAVVSAEYGIFLPNEAFRAGFSRFARDPSPEVQERYAWLRGQIDALPPEVSVSATSRLVPHVSNRRDVDVFPRGADYDYLLLEPRALDARAKRVLDDLVKQNRVQKHAEWKDITLYRRAPPPAP